VPVEIAGVPVPHLTAIGVRERARVERHAVPGMAGDLAQAMGRLPTEVTIRGSLHGAAAAEGLDRLRDAHAAGEPVELLVHAADESELVISLSFTTVLIEALEVEQHAGFVNVFDLGCRLVEYVEPPRALVGDPLAALDAELMADATAAIDAVQNGLAQASELSGLLAAGDFGNPTERLQATRETFEPLASWTAGALSTLRNLFGGGAPPPEG
jgi:hypothetical protein